MRREPLDRDPESRPIARAEPPAFTTRRVRGAKVRPCLGCGRPRWSTSPADRVHAACRREGEAEGERGGLVHPGGES